MAILCVSLQYYKPYMENIINENIYFIIINNYYLFIYKRNYKIYNIINETLSTLTFTLKNT